MLRKILLRTELAHFKQSFRCVSKRVVKVKNIENEAQQPVFQYPLSKESDRRVYVWGYQDTGALGLGEKETLKRHNLRTPKRLSFAEKCDITDLACGFGFTIYSVKSLDKYKVFGSGINTDSQLAFQQYKNQILDIIIYPLPIILPLQNETDTQILKMSAGRAHLLVLTSDGLYTLGNNSYGQCGRTVIEDEKYSGNSFIHHIPKINDLKIVDVHCGQDHSLVITENGQIFACGWGADGQTGLGHYNVESQFSPVGGDIKGEKIVKIVGRSDCVLALSDKGEVFGWGNSEYGQLLPESDIQQLHTPINLKKCDGLGRFTDVASGGSFCMALNDEGSVFVWGYGLLGKGPEVQQSYKPLEIPKLLFGKNDFQPDTKVDSITCGMGHMAAVTNSGDLYTWGKNRNGCLGLGHGNDQFFPLKVSIGATVEKVCCGVDHSIALCKPFI